MDLKELYNIYSSSIEKYNKMLESSDFSENERNNILLEKRSIEIIKNELEWNLLSDDEKEKKRIRLINSVKNLALRENKVFDFNYEDNVINFYNKLISVMEDIKKIYLKEDIYLYRVYLILQLEKNFINEFQDMKKIRHNDYYVFTNLLSEQENSKRYSVLEELKGLFIKMYKSWPNRPHKEI